MSARPIAHALFRRKRTFLVVLAAALLLGLILAFGRPPLYRAEATLLVDSGRPQAPRALAALFESRDLHAGVLTELGDRLYPRLGAADRVAAFADDLAVESDEAAALVRVSYDATAPDLAAQSLSMLVAGVRNRNASVFVMADAGSDEVLAAGATKAREKLAEARKRLGVFDAASERQALLARRARLDGERAAAEAEADASATILAGLHKRREATPKTIQLSSETERSSVVEQARAKVFELETEEQQLLGKYKDSSIFVERIRAERRKAESLLAQLMRAEDTKTVQGVNPVYQQLESEIVRLETAVDAARARAAGAGTQLAEVDGRLEDLAAIERDLTRLERDVAAADNALLGGSVRRQAVESIGVVQGAGAPARPIGPSATAILALSAAIGLIFASLAVFFGQRWSNRFSNPAEVENRLGLPVLTTIPRES